MKKQILSDAISDYFLDLNQPVVTKYDIGIFFIQAYLGGPLTERLSTLRKSRPESTDLNAQIRKLEDKRILVDDPDLSGDIYRVRDLPDGSAEEVCCAVDPFCYISHMSAMQWHSLTDRIPTKLILTTPPNKQWNRLAMIRTEEDFGDNWQFVTARAGIKCRRHKIPNKVRGRHITLHQTRYFGEPLRLRSPRMKLGSVGQTFLDMLVEPQLCGGMNHIIDVWQEHANTYIDEIVGVVNSCESSIAKVRAGYLIEEVVGLDIPIVRGWQQFAQRGGSRKLDPSKPFEARWSETWMLSINL